MYTYHNKSGYRVMEYDFSSITEFLQYISSHRVKSNIFGSYPSSETSDTSFTKSASLDEAKSLFKYGCHDDFEKLVELKCTLEKYIKMSRMKTRQYNFYVGYAQMLKLI